MNTGRHLVEYYGGKTFYNKDISFKNPFKCCGKRQYVCVLGEGGGGGGGFGTVDLNQHLNKIQN